MTVYGRRCFYCFVFIFVASGTRHGTGQQFKLKQGPEKGCAGCLIPELSHSLWWLTHILPGKTASEGYLRKRFAYTWALCSISR